MVMYGSSSSDKHAQFDKALSDMDAIDVVQIWRSYLLQKNMSDALYK